MMDGQDSFSRRDLIKGAGAGALALAAVAPERAEAAPKPLKGKAVLITGTSSGFGRLAAIHLGKEGARVIASMRNLQGGSRAEAKSLAAEAKAAKIDFHLVEIDVTKDDQVLAGVARAEEIASGALDAVINNAGIAVGGPVELSDQATIGQQFDVNLFGYHRMARAALPKMRARRQGLLIQVSSQLGRLVLPNIGVYCATKFAVEAMFEAMAYELAPFGVEATIIQPGGYPTDIWKNGARYFSELMNRTDDERKTAYAQHIEMSQRFFSGGGTTDPMDVPRAMADIIALPPGKRPLRRPVHPNTQASSAANAALAQIQARVLGGGAYKEWHDAVTN